MPVGRAGLSYADRSVKPLLKFVGGRPRATCKRMTEDIDDSPPPASSHGHIARAIKRDELDPISDSESSETRSRFRHSMDGDSDDTDEERRSRAAISRTTFGPSKPLKRSNNSPKQGLRFTSKASTTEEPKNQTQAKRRKLAEEEDEPVSTSPRRGVTSSQQSRASEPPSSAGSHLSESNGFTRRHVPKTTYGAGKKAGAKTSFKSSTVQGRVGSKAESKSSSSGFKHIPGSDDEWRSPKKVVKFKNPGELELPPASQSPPAAKFKMFDVDLFSPSPTDEASFVFPSHLGPSDSETKTSSAPKPVFQVFPESQSTDYPDFGPDDGLIATLPDTDSGDEFLGITDKKFSKTIPQTTVCPWCGDSVDEAFYKEFSRGARMNVRQQTRFCRRHKKQTALDTWKAKSYPVIDWDEMPRRVASHHDFLTEIVNGKSSYYRTKLAKMVESGQSRALKKEDNLNPGYYGPKGFNMMCDLLVQKFTNLLKERAVHDPVISGRGSAAFIQCVLVAELAVQLIMHDMSVPAEEARTIMEDSKALGEVVQDE